MKVCKTILLSILTISLCLHNSCSDSQTLSIEKGIGHFSLEYPASYIIDKIECREDYDYTDIVLHGYGVKLEGGERDYTYINIFIQKSNNTLHNAEDAAEQTIEFYKKLPDFLRMEKSVVNIGEIVGHQIVFYFDISMKENPEEFEEDPLPRVIRIVYFDYNDLIWNLSVSSNPTVIDEANTTFNNILNTFTLLN